MDVMLDSKLKPWLIECNHSPSFGIDTPLDLNIKVYLRASIFFCTISSCNAIMQKAYAGCVVCRYTLSPCCLSGILTSPPPVWLRRR